MKKRAAARVRDRLWLWAHEAGSHNGNYHLPGDSTITPAQAAARMGLDGVIMVVLGDRPAPPFEPAAAPLAGVRRLVWSIVGDSSSHRTDDAPDLDAVVSLARTAPNLTGGIMDDFFLPASAGRVSRHSPERLAAFRAGLRAAARPLDLWVVLYAHDLDRPVAPHLAECDVVTFWTWKADDLGDLPRNLDRARALAPGKRIVQGCYMWDYGNGRPMPVETMRAQCEQGLDWIRSGRTDGMIFLASCVCDLGIESVEWSRRWIADVGDEPLPDRKPRA